MPTRNQKPETRNAGEAGTHHSAPNPDQHRATLAGFGAILLWSTTVALARSLSEALGPVTAAAVTYSIGGLFAIAVLVSSRRKRRRIFHLPRNYLFGCGSLFVFYMLVLFLAIGWAADRSQVLEVGLINYLWPAFILLFSIPILGQRPRWMLFPGILLALAGIYLVMTHETSVSWPSFVEHTRSNPLVYALGLSAALSWALYSTLTNRWAGEAPGGGVELFLPVTGVLLIGLTFTLDETYAATWKTLVEAVFLGAATYGGYALWDFSMRKGNVTVVSSAAYLTPLFATLLAALYLSSTPGPRLWLGCVVLIAGSVLSGRS